MEDYFTDTRQKLKCLPIWLEVIFIIIGILFVTACTVGIIYGYGKFWWVYVWVHIFKADESGSPFLEFLLMIAVGLFMIMVTCIPILFIYAIFIDFRCECAQHLNNKDSDEVQDNKLDVIPWPDQQLHIIELDDSL